MKKKLALLFVLIMVLSSMPVMAAAVSADPAGAASDVTTQAAKNVAEAGSNLTAILISPAM